MKLDIGQAIVKGVERVAAKRAATLSTVSTSTTELSGFVTNINTEHEFAVRAARSAVEHAIQCGKWLLQAKEAVGHGGWLKWVSENLSFTDRTATGYMNLAALPEANQKRVADLPLRQALKAIAGPSRQASEPEEDKHTEKAQKRAGRKASSRAARWQGACERASTAIQELIDLQSEYESWRESLPENLQEGATAEKLQAIADLDISALSESIEGFSNIELPLGFGRDG